MYSQGAVMMIPLLFYNRLILSEASFLADQIIPNEGAAVVRKFFTEYKGRMEKSGVRDLVVLAASDEQLQRRGPLLENVPHSFGTDAVKLCRPGWITTSTLVVMYLDNLEERGLRRGIKELSTCKTYQIHVIFESRSTMTLADVHAVLQIFVDEIGVSPFFIHHNHRDNSVKVYRHVLGRHCVTRTKLVVNWRPGDDVMKVNGLIRPPPIAKCSLNVAAVHNPPWMVLEKHGTGGERIKGGLEGDIILEFARIFNYTVTVQSINLTAHDTRVASETVVASCASGKSNIGIGRIRPTESVNSRALASHMYTQECVVWCVPRIVGFRRDPLFSEFSWTVWISIGIIFLGTFTIASIVRKTIHPNKVPTRIVRQVSCIRVLLDIVGVTLGNPIVHRPVSIGGKALLIAYICYCTVMTTAYKTSLSSLLTAGNLRSTIVDVQGIIEANLTTGGNALGLAILEDQRNESKWTPKLIDRYLVERNMSKALRRVSEDRDFAVLISLSDLTYHKTLFEKSREKISFDVLNDCVLSHIFVAALPRRYGGHLLKDLNRGLRTWVENGVLLFWKQTEFQSSQGTRTGTTGSGMINSQEELRSITRHSILYLSNIYGVIMAISILVFLRELFLPKFRTTGRNRRLDNLKLFKISRRTTLHSASRPSD